MPYIGQRVRSLTSPNCFGTVTGVFDEDLCEQSVCVTWDWTSSQGWFTKDFRCSKVGVVCVKPMEDVQPKTYKRC